MTPIVAAHRAYYFIALCLAAWVGYLGLFKPDELGRALPVSLATPDARLVGAIYLAGSVSLALSAAAAHLAVTRTVLRAVLVWTGWLLLMSLIDWKTADAARPSSGYWWLACAGLPAGAVALTAWARLQWKARSPKTEIAGDPVDSRIPIGGTVLMLAIVAVVFGILGLASAATPALAAQMWPWPISGSAARQLSAPLLGFAIAAADLTARRSRLGVTIPLFGLLGLGICVIAAMTLERAHFAAAPTAAYAWYAALAVLAGACAASIWKVTRA